MTRVIVQFTLTLILAMVGCVATWLLTESIAWALLIAATTGFLGGVHFALWMEEN